RTSRHPPPYAAIPSVATGAPYPTARGRTGSGRSRPQVPLGKGTSATMVHTVRDAAHLLHPTDPEFDEIGETRLHDVVAELITGLGEDLTREGLVKTPERVERSLRFLTSGYDARVEDVVNGALFAA